VSPAKRHRTAEHVRETLGTGHIPERRTRHVPEDEPRLVRRIIDLATSHDRYGYRQITMMLREEDWIVNHKRTERLLRLLADPLDSVRKG